VCNAGVIFGVLTGGFFTMIGSVLFGMLGYCVYTCYLTQQRWSISQLFGPTSPLIGVGFGFDVVQQQASEKSEDRNKELIKEAEKRFEERVKCNREELQEMKKRMDELKRENDRLLDKLKDDSPLNDEKRWKVKSESLTLFMQLIEDQQTKHKSSHVDQLDAELVENAKSIGMDFPSDIVHKVLSSILSELKHHKNLLEIKLNYSKPEPVPKLTMSS